MRALRPRASWMKVVRRLPLAAAITLASWCSTAWASDQDDPGAKAHALALHGAEEFNSRQYELALQHFKEALAIAQIPSVAVSTAQTQAQIGELVEASVLYESALSMTPNEFWVGTLQQQWQTEAQQALVALKPRIPRVTLEVTGTVGAAEVVITVDGKTVRLAQTPIPLNPGSHVVVAQQGTKTTQESLALAEGEDRTLVLRLVERAPPTTWQPTRPIAPPAVAESHPRAAWPVAALRNNPPSDFQRKLGWVGVSVGASSLVVGITSGILVGIKRSSLHDAGCSGNTCVGPAYRDRLDTYNNLRTVSSVAFVIGTVAAAGGVTLLLTDTKSNSTRAMNLMVTPEQVSLVGVY